MNMQRKLGLAVVLGAVVALGACGSDDDEPVRPILTTTPTQDDIGGSSGTSGDLVAYVQRLIAADPADADLAEPLDISGITLPTTASDLEEPIAPI